MRLAEAAAIATAEADAQFESRRSSDHLWERIGGLEATLSARERECHALKVRSDHDARVATHLRRLR